VREKCNALRVGRVGPPDGTNGEYHSHIKTAPSPRLAIHDSSRLRELTCKGSKKKVLPRLPETFGHQASAMRADVARDGPLGKTRLVSCCEMHGDNRGGALLNSSVEKQLATSERWSKSIHSRVISPGGSSYSLESDVSASPTAFITFGYRRGNRGKAAIYRRQLP
jgi:hypothetical protein